MKYVLLIYHSEDYLGQGDGYENERVLDSHRELQSQGKADGSYLGAVRLAPSDTAVSIRHQRGDIVVTDGPFAETKEQLVGFYLFDEAERDSATDHAKDLRMFPGGSVEVRPVRWAHPRTAFGRDRSSGGGQ